MGTPDLTTKDFWVSASTLVMANPLDATAVSEAEFIREWVMDQPGLSVHMLFRTSGSSGKGKWVALSKTALLESAQAVNDFLKVTAEDRWLQTLPLFHVGGMGIAARGYVAGCDVIGGLEKWDAVRCSQLLAREKITLTSLVPAQMADLISLGVSAPESLRAVVIGGGRLDATLYQNARDHGWPVQESYGMTETCSQVATALPGERDLCVLPLWDVTEHADGCLQVRGNAMFTGYVGCGENGCFIEDPKDDAWFVTHDRGVVVGDHLIIHGRSDRCVKILGELVDLSEVEQEIQEVIKKMERPYQELAVMAVAPPEAGVHMETRRGTLLIACVEQNENLSDVLEKYNADCHPLHRIKGVALLDSLPRTGIGKISYPELELLLKSER